MTGWLVLFLWTGCGSGRKIYDIRSFGAVSDSVILNTAAIQKAIDAASASGGGTVLIPAGTYVTGVIHLKSHVELHLDSQAVLLGTDQRLAYGRGDASALIVADGQHHIAITGTGVIDGGADKLLKNLDSLLKAGVIADSEWQRYNPWHQMRPAERNRPKIIDFQNCDSVWITGICLKNSLDWVQKYQHCMHLVIHGIKVQSTAFWNNDGIDLVDCQHARISGCDIDADDDGICLKSEDRESRCEDILIEDCNIRSSASAIKLGTASAGGFKHITIKHIRIHDTYRSAIALESVDGGTLEDVHVSDIEARRTGNAFFIRLGHRNHDSVISQLSNVYIDHLTVTIPAGKPDSGYPMQGPEVGFPHHVFPASITGIPGHPVSNVVLQDVDVTYPGGASKRISYFNADTLERVPERIDGYPEFSMFGELPCWALYTRWARGITLRRVRFSSNQHDFRPALIFDHIRELTLDSLDIPSKTEPPIVILNKVTDYHTCQLHWPVSAGKATRITNR